MKFQLVWFDSMGAKCSCVLVETPDVNILIDPGAAEMQRSFPLSDTLKSCYCDEAFRAIQDAGEKADFIVISHYHYDHHCRIDEPHVDGRRLYSGKTIWAKDPNSYINESQWKRARLFFSQICETFGETSLEELEVEPKDLEYPDPMDSIPLARSKDFGDYSNRRRSLMEKGRKWFDKLVDKWCTEAWIPEPRFKKVKVRFADGKSFHVGKTRVRFTSPLFHGIEFDRIGWVLSTIVEHSDQKLIHSSDLQGPVIEDYAEWIVRENPDVLVLDGPPTYLFGYTVNRINLNRSIDNIVRIIENVDAQLIILDHHLPRDRLYRQRLSKVYEVAERRCKQVTTAAEYLGDQPVIIKATS